MLSVILAWSRLLCALLGALTGLVVSGVLLSGMPSPWYLWFGQLVAVVLYGPVLLVVHTRTRSDVLHELALAALAAPAGLSVIGVLAAMAVGFHNLGLSRGWSVVAALALAAAVLVSAAVWWGRRQLRRAQGEPPAIVP